MRILARMALYCLAALPLPVFAQASVTLQWTPPTQYENGDALDPTKDLTGYGVYVDGTRVATAAPGTMSYMLSDLSFGAHDYYVTAIATNGQESAMSNVVSKTIVDARKPKPPTLLDALIAFVRRLVRWLPG